MPYGPRSSHAPVRRRPQQRRPEPRRDASSALEAALDAAAAVPAPVMRAAASISADIWVSSLVVTPCTSKIHCQEMARSGHIKALDGNTRTSAKLRLIPDLTRWGPWQLDQPRGIDLESTAKIYREKIWREFLT